MTGHGEPAADILLIWENPGVELEIMESTRKEESCWTWLGACSKVVAAEDRLVIVWLLCSAKVAAAFSGHASPVTSLDFSTDFLLLSPSSDETLMVWSVEGVDENELVLSLGEAKELVKPKRNALQVSMKDVERFYPYLCNAVRNFVKDRVEVAQDKEFYVSLTDVEVALQVRELKTLKIGTLTKITGQVFRTHPELVSGTFTCLDCHTLVPDVEQQFKFTQPTIYKNPVCNNRSRFMLEINMSRFQKVRIQKVQAELPRGCIPRSVEIILPAEAVESVQAGDRCDFTGTLIVVPDVGALNVGVNKESDSRHQGQGDNAEVVRGLKSLGVRDLHYRMAFLACGVASANKNKLSGCDDDDIETPEEMKAKMSASEWEVIYNKTKNRNLYSDLITNMFATIHGNNEVKRGVMLMLFGGVPKTTPDGTSPRGDINLCVVGDPSTAKSQFLKMVADFCPRAVYTSGKASSAAGLTAAVVKDEESNEFVIEAGALMLADNGVCCIDEFDKMEVHDTVAIHEAMEQQTITKAGVKATLNARASILAAANPINGRYDRSKSLVQNIEMSAPIMSRFDLFFILVDDCNEVTDYAIARRIIDLHTHLSESVERVYTPQQIAQYINFARMFKPKISPESQDLLVEQYRKLRQRDTGGSAKSSWKINVRQLESMLRLSEAFARMHCNDKVGIKHVKEADQAIKKQMKLTYEEFKNFLVNSEEPADTNVPKPVCGVIYLYGQPAPKDVPEPFLVCVELNPGPDCIICYDDIVYPAVLSCGHSGCYGCIAGALTRSKTCPVCRVIPAGLTMTYDNESEYPEDWTIYPRRPTGHINLHEFVRMLDSHGSHQVTSSPSPNSSPNLNPNLNLTPSPPNSSPNFHFTQSPTMSPVHHGDLNGSPPSQLPSPRGALDTSLRSRSPTPPPLTRRRSRPPVRFHDLSFGEGGGINQRENTPEISPTRSPDGSTVRQRGRGRGRRGAAVNAPARSLTSSPDEILTQPRARGRGTNRGRGSQPRSETNSQEGNQTRGRGGRGLMLRGRALMTRSNIPAGNALNRGRASIAINSTTARGQPSPETRSSLFEDPSEEFTGVEETLGNFNPGNFNITNLIDGTTISHQESVIEALRKRLLENPEETSSSVRVVKLVKEIRLMHPTAFPGLDAYRNSLYGEAVSRAIKRILKQRIQARNILRAASGIAASRRTELEGFVDDILQMDREREAQRAATSSRMPSMAPSMRLTPTEREASTVTNSARMRNAEFLRTQAMQAGPSRNRHQNLLEGFLQQMPGIADARLSLEDSRVSNRDERRHEMFLERQRQEELKEAREERRSQEHLAFMRATIAPPKSNGVGTPSTSIWVKMDDTEQRSQNFYRQVVAINFHGLKESLANIGEKSSDKIDGIILVKQTEENSSPDERMLVDISPFQSDEKYIIRFIPRSRNPDNVYIKMYKK